MGKGDTYRKVDKKKFDANYEKIFRDIRKEQMRVRAFLRKLFGKRVG